MIQKFLNSICFKSIILNLDENEIIETLDLQEKPLEGFITLLIDTIVVDPSFFALDDSILDKILRVINNYRFEEKYRDEETINTINDIIIFCNEVRYFSEDEKDMVYLDYIRRQSVERHKFIFFKDDLFDAISMDAVVYEAIINNDVDDPDIKENIIPSTYYLLHNCFPLVIDEDYYNNLKNILMDNSILNGKEKRRGKKILKTMKKIDNII